MSIDWDAQLLDPLYDESSPIAAAVQFLARDGTKATLRVIDARSGSENASNGVLLQGETPAVCVRVSELEASNLNQEKMRNGRLSFADRVWNVESAKPKPVPFGKGELTLFLQERKDG